jgi:hypothetical protein
MIYASNNIFLYDIIVFVLRRQNKQTISLLRHFPNQINEQFLPLIHDSREEETTGIFFINRTSLKFVGTSYVLFMF